MNETPLVEILDVKKYFPVYQGWRRKIVGYIKAVDGVTLRIHTGQVHAVVGESGSGKSTLGQIAISLQRPTAGKVLFQGQDAHDLLKRDFKNYKKSCQVIFQDPISSLNPRHTIEKTLGDGLLFHALVKTEKEKKEKIVDLLEGVGLMSDAMERYPHQFSGGQQQRLAIARAISLNPQFIVCDEAVSALDTSIQSQILNLLSQLQKELHLSYLFISHDLSIVRHFSDTVTVMYLGKVMETGPAASIFTNPKHPYTQILLESVPKKTPDESKPRVFLQGEIPSAMNPPSGCPFHTRCPYAQPICKEPPPEKNRGADHKYYCILD